jgi:hypothetical protein
MRLATKKECQKDDERRILDRVAWVRGTPLVYDSRDPDAFPDGFFDEDDREQPVEVVEAFEREPGEDPRKGSQWRRAWQRAQAMAQEIEQGLGVHAAWGAHGSEPFAIPLDGTTLIPPRLTLVHPEQWVAAAVQQKLARKDRYEVNS